MILKTADNSRDQAIITFLLDTGIRASELCSLKVADVDLKMGKVFVQGKGSKERHCYLGKTARRSLWRYLTDRDDDPNAPLFITQGDRPFQRHWLRELVASIGNKAGVSNAHPHRFRHTFAVQFLRNGGGHLHATDAIGPLVVGYGQALRRTGRHRRRAGSPKGKSGGSLFEVRDGVTGLSVGDAVPTSCDRRVAL